MSLARKLGWAHALVFMALVLAAVLFASKLTPRQRMSDQNQDVSLEAEIPLSFKGWRVDQEQRARVVNPQQTEILETIYAQNLMRVYVNEQGQRIMLAVAYGSSQKRGLELHRPEVCYVAQGHSIERMGSSFLSAHGLARSVPLERLMARSPRGGNEPISYWMRVGDEVMASGVSQPFMRLKYGLLKGLIPDGVLFRVSSYSGDDSAPAYALQEQFVQDLLAATSPRLQRFLIGPVSGNTVVTPS